MNEKVLRDEAVSQSARVNPPAQVAGLDAGKTPVAEDRKTLVADSLEVEEDKGPVAKKKTSESIAVEPCKSSKYGWLIRVRLNSLPGRPAIPISYMGDREYKQLRRSKKRYEEFKRNIKKQYQKAAW